LAKLNFVPTVIFTTAFDQYAIKAFQENSIDYLLKPIEAERLELTVQKLQKLTRNTSEKETAHLLAALEKLQPKKEIRSLPVKIGDRILLIKTEDISHIDADDKYVFLHTLTGESHLTDFTLSGLESKLPSNFVRVHRGCIINAEKIREFRRGFNGAYAIVMNNQESTKITSSRSYADEVKKLFEI
jgi:two-component system LytT family response regulator